MGRVGAVVLVAAFAAQSPQALRTSIFKAAHAEHSVHYVSTSVQGKHHSKVVADVAATKGIQRWTLSMGGRTGHATVLVVSRTAYIRGDEFALTEMGFSKADASRFANSWLRIPHGNALYAPVAEAVTLPSFLTDLYPQSGLASSTGTLHGRSVHVLSGRLRIDGVATKETLYASSTGRPLPLAAAQTSAKPSQQTNVVIGPWNKPVVVTAPGNTE